MATTPLPRVTCWTQAPPEQGHFNGLVVVIRKHTNIAPTRYYIGQVSNNDIRYVDENDVLVILEPNRTEPEFKSSPSVHTEYIYDGDVSVPIDFDCVLYEPIYRVDIIDAQPVITSYDYAIIDSGF